MSVEEKFFNPKVLARVAKHVEWPGNLELYRNGTTNQGEFMRAVGELYGQLFAGEYLPDAWAAAKIIAKRDCEGAMLKMVEEIPQKIEQVVGFWTGFFGGSLSRRKSLWGPVNPWTGEISVSSSDPDATMEAILRTFVVKIASIIEGVYDG